MNISDTFNIRYLLYLLRKCPTDIYAIKTTFSDQQPSPVHSRAEWIPLTSL